MAPCMVQSVAHIFHNALHCPTYCKVLHMAQSVAKRWEVLWLSWWPPAAPTDADFLHHTVKHPWPFLYFFNTLWSTVDYYFFFLWFNQTPMLLTEYFKGYLNIYIWWLLNRRARLLRAACKGRSSCEELSREEVGRIQIERHDDDRERREDDAQWWQQCWRPWW